MKKFSILIVVALVVSLFVLPAAFAQSITWTSGFQVQNLSDTTNATVVIYYYNQDGTLAISEVTDTIPMGESKTYFPIHAGDGFNGSVVVESTEPVVAIANTLGDFPQYAASTESFSSGASEIKLPLIMRNNAGYSTWFNVQNTSATDDAVVTIQYVPQTGSAFTEGPVTVPPGASATFDQQGMTQLGTTFVGSAVVSTSPAVPVVATVMQVGATFQNMMGYNGFTGGSQNVSLPLVMANNNGYWTGVQVQNVGAGDTTVTISYGDNLAGAFSPTDEQVVDLGANESHTFFQNAGQFATPTYVGSASITSDREDVVAIVNQVKLTGTAVGTAYNGFDPAAATDKISAPLIMANNSGFYTGFQVMNVGGSPADITVTYGPNLAGAFAPSSETANIGVGDSYNSIQNLGAWAGNTYVGSITVQTTDPADQVVMIVNEIWPAAAGDQFMTYGGFNY